MNTNSSASVTRAVTGNIRRRLEDGHGVRLMEQIGLMERQLLPTLAQYERKRQLLDAVSETLRSRGRCDFGGRGGLVPFGSCESGLWSRGSDIDACLVMENCEDRGVWQSQLKVTMSLIKRMKAASSSLQFGDCSMVTSAKVPVLKVTDAAGRECLDISVNNLAALDNTALVKVWGELDGRFRTLARVVKHWASRRRINDRAQGTLSTYTLLLQIVFVLQQHKILPPFAAVQPLLTPAAGEAAPASGECALTSADLLKLFFDYYGSEKVREGVEISDGEAKSSGEGVLIMRCPLTCKNVNPMTRSTWLAIHNEFARAREMLVVDRRLLFEICQAPSPS